MMVYAAVTANHAIDTHRGMNEVRAEIAEIESPVVRELAEDETAMGMHKLEDIRNLQAALAGVLMASSIWIGRKQD
jgi:hypothetical protein